MKHTITAVAAIIIAITSTASAGGKYVNSHARYMKIMKAMAKGSMTLDRAQEINFKINIDCIMAGKLKNKNMKTMHVMFPSYNPLPMLIS